MLFFYVRFKRRKESLQFRASGLHFYFRGKHERLNIWAHASIYWKRQHMKSDNRLHIRITALLLAKAHDTARQDNATLSRVVRAYLEAYTASRPYQKAE